MTRYPVLVQRLAGRDLNMIAKRSNVPVDVIEALVAGTHAADIPTRRRLARVLRVRSVDLFALDPAAEAALADVERQGFPRLIEDAAVLRVIDQ